MKNIRYTAAGLAALLLAGCNASDDYPDRSQSPAQNPESMQVYFPAPAATDLELETDQPTELTVEVARVRTQSAATVPITVTQNTDNVFVVPASVEFAAGQETAEIRVVFPDAQTGVEYRLGLAVEGEQYADPYYVGQPAVYFTVSRLKWESFATGDYYAAPFEETMNGVELYRAAGTDKFRFFNLYAEGYNFSFEWDGESAALQPGGVAKIYTDVAEYPVYVQESGLLEEGAMLFWVVDATEDYTFWDPEKKMFQFEFVMAIFPGDVIGDTPTDMFGWFDDTFTITSFAGDAGGE